MINLSNWAYFKIEDIFNVSKGVADAISRQEEGSIPLVSSTERNNGIKNYVSENNKNKLFTKNKITVAVNGSIGESFYQPEDFYATSDVAVLDLKDYTLTKNIAFFLIGILKKEQFKYTYGRKWNLTRLKDTEIKLPVDENNKPDWAFMESFINELFDKDIEDFIAPKNDKVLDLWDRQWEKFKLEDIFSFQRGKRLIKNDRSPGDIPYMSASETNNGITDKISNPLFTVDNAICLTTFGDAFYHKSTFTTSDEVIICKNDNLNEFNGLFIVGILQKEKYKYSFGRKLYFNKIKHIEIKLPVKPKTNKDDPSEIDWIFMEEFIKGLPYTKQL